MSLGRPFLSPTYEWSDTLMTTTKILRSSSRMRSKPGSRPRWARQSVFSLWRSLTRSSRIWTFLNQTRFYRCLVVKRVHLPQSLLNPTPTRWLREIIGNDPKGMTAALSPLVESGLFRQTGRSTVENVVGFSAMNIQCMKWNSQGQPSMNLFEVSGVEFARHVISLEKATVTAAVKFIFQERILLVALLILWARPWARSHYLLWSTSTQRGRPDLVRSLTFREATYKTYTAACEFPPRSE